MPKISVEKAFNLRKESGEVVSFEPGDYTVDKETAEHWFVKAHLVGASYEPKEGSFEYAQRNRALKSEEDTAAAEQQAEADAQARAESEARAAALLQKTNEAIAAVAQQAQDNITKKDGQPADAVTDLPPIPLASGAQTGEAPQPSGEGGEGQAAEQQAEAAEQQAEAGEQKAE
ncbi:STY1053 family phage-associated protein [Rhizobium sp. No.120]